VAVISIITIAKDHALGLAVTHKSVLEQDFKEWEMVIIVGASSDDSLTYALELQLHDPRIKVVEQGGLGIYQAMNEGLSIASADIVWFMNAGDRFANSKIVTLAIVELVKSQAAMVIGGYQVDHGFGNQMYCYSYTRITPFKFAFNRRGGCHQAMIFDKSALAKVGGFNTRYSLASDFDLALKIVKSEKVIRVPEIYALIEPGGRAAQGINHVYKQKHEIRKELLPGRHIELFSLLWTSLAKIKRYLTQ
jgi:glycosyltransferase involved in cell wall biosynthesis